MTTLIKNGLVYDGSGDLPRKADILIRKDRIMRIGKFSHKDANHVVDATNALVMPGFIDVDSGADHTFTLFEDHFFHTLLRQGVTSVVLGSCGSSLAPLLYGSFISLRKWGAEPNMNLTWGSMKDFARQMKKGRLRFNMGTLVGHSTIRRAIAKEEIRDLSDEELETFLQIIRMSLNEGAFGLSVGVEFEHSAHTSPREFLEIARVLKEYDSVFSVKLPSEKEFFLTHFNRFLEIAKETHTKTHFGRLQPSRNLRDEKYVAIHDGFQHGIQNANITFDSNTLPYTSFPLYLLLPYFAREKNLETMLRHLHSELISKKLLAYFKHIPSKDLIFETLPPTLRFLQGKSLNDLVPTFHSSASHALLKILKLTRLRGTCILRDSDVSRAYQQLLLPYGFFASGGLLNRGAFLNFLSGARDEQGFGIQKAVSKMTHLPAVAFGLKRRGLIKEGYFADVVVLKDFVPSEVLVNGSVVMCEGVPKDVHAGKFLCRGEVV